MGVLKVDPASRRGVPAWLYDGIVDSRSLIARAARWMWPADAADRVALAAILAWATAIRVFFLREPIRFDEAGNALYYADRSIVHAVGGLAGNENHILNTVLVWLSVRLLGWSEAAVRLPVLVVGVALCGAVFGFVHWHLRDSRAGLIAAAIVATSPWLVFFSVNARGYIYQPLAMVAMCWAVLAVARANARQAALLGVLAGLAAGVGMWAARNFVLFVAGAAVAAVVLAVASARGAAGSGGRPALTPARPFLRRYGRFLGFFAISTLFFTALLYGPLFLAHGWAGSLGVISRISSPLDIALRDTTSSLLKVVPTLVDTVDGRLAPVAYGLLVLGVVFARRATFQLLTLVVVALAMAYPVTLATSFGMFTRSLTAVAGLLAALLAASLEPILRRLRRGPASLAVLLCLFGYSLLWMRQDLLTLRNRTGDMPHVREAAVELLAYPNVEREILLMPALYDVGVAFYFRRAGVDPGGLVGYDRGYDGRGRCDGDSVLVYVPPGWPLRDAVLPELEDGLRDRLALSRARERPLEAIGAGSIWRVPVADRAGCP